MTPTRNLRLGACGADVRRIKDQLFLWGYYAPHITSIRHDAFGLDTLAAVRRFQAANGLFADGVIGPLTHSAIERASGGASLTEQPTPPNVAGDLGIPANIGPVAAAAIASSLASAAKIRRSIALDALQFAFDRQVMCAYPLSLYIRGGNLYNTDLSPNVITLSRIASGAARQPGFYDGGRREMMEQAVLDNPAITGADCSGGVVGLLRHAGVVKPGFDLSANGFWSNTARYRRIARSDLQCADILHKNGHVGIYVGGGYAVEWMGGAYGCQLTALDVRHGYSFVTARTSRMGAWTGFLCPTYY